jgi:hypothetical protein
MAVPHHNGSTALGADPELHPDLYFIGCLELRFRHLVYKGLVAGTVPLLGIDDDRKFISRRFAFQFLLQARDDLPGPVDVIEGLPTIGCVKDLPIFIFEGIVNGHNTVFAYLHLVLLPEYLT